MNRLVVKSWIQNGQWDDFKKQFPDLESLSAFTTRNKESILHLVARFASESFAQKVIRAYHLDDKDSLVVKELWARRDNKGELCVNFERFKKYFNKPFLKKVEAVYSGRYFEKPEEKWPEEKQTNPHAQVYKLFRRYALRAAFDGNAGLKKDFPSKALPVMLFLPAINNQVRIFPVYFDLKSRTSFLRQIYHQLDCPEDAMSPMLASVYLFDKTIRNMTPDDHEMQAAFKYFQEQHGILKFENYAITSSPTAVMYAEIDPEPASVGITISSPRRQTLPASFQEVLTTDKEAHWLYKSFRGVQKGKMTKESFWHELVHVTDLTQESPLSLSPLFTYSVLCLMAHLTPEDKNLKFVITEVLSLYSTRDLFTEYATVLLANTEPSDNMWYTKIRQLISFLSTGARAPAVANRIQNALSDWNPDDLNRLDELVYRFGKLHTDKCPMGGRFLPGKILTRRWRAYRDSAHKMLTDFFGQNKDLAPKVLRSLTQVLKDLPILTENATTLGAIVLSEGWLDLLKKYPLAELPEAAVFREMIKKENLSANEQTATARLNKLIDACPQEIKKPEDVQALLSAVICAHQVKAITKNEFTDEHTALGAPDYQQLTDGTVLNGLKNYAGFLIRTQAERRRPVLISSHKKKSQDESHQKED